MQNVNKRLEDYAKRCDEVYLQKHLKALLEESLENIELVEVEDLSNNVILIDVREPEEFSSGYISANTVLTIPRGKLEFLAIDKIAKVYGQDANIVTYCLKGPRGYLAAYQLKRLGFKNVKSLKGGILAWLESKRAIVSYLGELVLK